MTKIIKLKYYTELGYRVDLPGNQEGEYVPLAEYRELESQLEQARQEALDACGRRNIAYAVAENLQQVLRELLSASKTTLIFCETGAARAIDEEYQRLVINPLKDAIARAEGR